MNLCRHRREAALLRLALGETLQALEDHCSEDLRNRGDACVDDVQHELAVQMAREQLGQEVRR